MDEVRSKAITYFTHDKQLHTISYDYPTSSDLEIFEASNLKAIARLDKAIDFMNYAIGLTACITIGYLFYLVMT